jgi:hypothetical protein
MLTIDVPVAALSWHVVLLRGIQGLTEDPDVSVLLLEAGARDDVAEIDGPRAYVQLFKRLRQSRSVFPPS